MTAIHGLLPGCRGGLVHDDNVIAKNLRTEDPKHCGHQSETGCSLSRLRLVDPPTCSPPCSWWAAWCPPALHCGRTASCPAEWTGYSAGNTGSAGRRRRRWREEGEMTLWIITWFSLHCLQAVGCWSLLWEFNTECDCIATNCVFLKQLPNTVLQL